MSEIASTQAPDSSQSGATLEQSLNKTDMGHWIYEHRKSFIAAIAVVLVGTIGFVGYKQQQKAELGRLSDQVSKFESTAVADLKAKKMPAAEFVASFKALDSKLQTTPSMVPVAIDSAAALREMGETKAAQEILKPMVSDKGLKASSAAYMFVALNYAALAESNGESDEAIRVLEAYVASGHKVFLTKAYLDLGRLYLAKKDTARAKTNLDYIVNNHPNDEMAKLARLYLQRLTVQ